MKKTDYNVALLRQFFYSIIIIKTYLETQIFDLVKALLLFLCMPIIVYANTDVTFFDGKTKTLRSIIDNLNIPTETEKHYSFITHKLNNNNLYVLHKFKKCYQQEYRENFFCASHVNRSLSLIDFYSHLNEVSLKDYLSNLSKNKTVRVLELGAGNGRIMAELASQYPSFRITGFNKGGEDDFGLSALGDKHFQKLIEFYELELTSLHNIEIKYKDLSDGRLDMYKSSMFDFLYSVETFQYIENKEKLLREIWRVLKPDSLAVINIRHTKYLDANGEIININQWLLKNELTQFLKFYPKYDVWVLQKKREDFPLSLILQSNSEIKYNAKEKNNNFVGWHSVYKVKVKK